MKAILGLLAKAARFTAEGLLYVASELEVIPLYWRVTLVFDMLMFVSSVALYRIAIQENTVSSMWHLLPLGFAFWVSLVASTKRYLDLRQRKLVEISVWDE